jgi:intraflagellar transport protein 140
MGNWRDGMFLLQAAGDFLSLVRTYCAQGDYEVAASLVEESADPAAAFHLARTFEAMDEHAEAIRFFGLAGRSVSFYFRTGN